MICLKAGAKLRIIFELTADYADFTVFSGNKSRFCRFYLIIICIICVICVICGYLEKRFCVAGIGCSDTYRTGNCRCYAFGSDGYLHFFRLDACSVENDGEGDG